MIWPSRLQMRSAFAPPHEPSASKTPARKPLRHCWFGLFGQRMSSVTASYVPRDPDRIQRISRRVAVAGGKRGSLDATGRASKEKLARGEASKSGGGGRQVWGR